MQRQLSIIHYEGTMTYATHESRGKLINRPRADRHPHLWRGRTCRGVQAHLGQSVLFPKRLGTGEELAFAVMECITNPYMNAEVIRLDGGIRMPPE